MSVAIFPTLSQRIRVGARVFDVRSPSGECGRVTTRRPHVAVVRFPDRQAVVPVEYLQPAED